MLLSMVRAVRVILVKLADRMHKMRTIGAMAPPRRRAIARETLEIYAPIAERLGLYNIKLELEDLGFEALYPRRYQVLEHALRRARGNQKEFLKKIEQQLNAGLLKSNIQAHVVAREKHLYSIYSKMRRKRAMLNEIVDVYGIRIVVDTPDTCYRALGAVHSVFKPMPARFKDYIAIPRVNGYPRAGAGCGQRPGGWKQPPPRARPPPPRGSTSWRGGGRAAPSATTSRVCGAPKPSRSVPSS